MCGGRHLWRCQRTVTKPLYVTGWDENGLGVLQATGVCDSVKVKGTARTVPLSKTERENESKKRCSLETFGP